MMYHLDMCEKVDKQDVGRAYELNYEPVRDVCSTLRYFFFFFSSRRRHTRSLCDWNSDVCSSDLAAANAFLGRHDCALPVAAPRNERPPEVLVLHDDADASPTEPAAFRPTPEELADAASRHLEGGGTIVAFGRACEGEPLLAVRVVEEAIVAIRERTRLGTIHLETNGSSPVALRRLCDAGLDSVAVRVVSAREETYEAIHRPEGFRFADVRASIAHAIAGKVSVALRVLALPGLTDRARG